MSLDLPSTRLSLVVLVGLFLPATGMAQVTVLWEQASPVSGSAVPASAGTESPFPQPEVAEEAGPSETELVAQQERAAAQRRALAEALRLTAPQLALTLDRSRLSIGAVVTNPTGARVLIQNEWYAEGARLPLAYQINPQTRQALVALREFDQAKARELANQLDQRMLEVREAGVVLHQVQQARRTVVLRTALGDVELAYPSTP